MVEKPTNLKRKWAIVRRLLKEHPTLALTFPYLLASVAGAAYSWVLLANFGINFFHYAQLTDFALCAFRAGFTVVWAVACSFGIGAFMLWASGRKDTKFTSKLMLIGFAMIVLFSAGTGVLAGWADATSAKFTDSDVDVYLNSSSSDGKPVLLGRDVSLISTAGAMMFFFDRDTHTAIAVPFAQRHHVAFRRRQR